MSLGGASTKVEVEVCTTHCNEQVSKHSPPDKTRANGDTRLEVASEHQQANQKKNPSCAKEEHALLLTRLRKPQAHGHGQPRGKRKWCEIDAIASERERANAKQQRTTATTEDQGSCLARRLAAQRQPRQTASQQSNVERSLLILQLVILSLGVLQHPLLSLAVGFEFEPSPRALVALAAVLRRLRARAAHAISASSSSLFHTVTASGGTRPSRA